MIIRGKFEIYIPATAYRLRGKKNYYRRETDGAAAAATTLSGAAD